MTSLVLHPETGLHYIAVIPGDHGPFSDIRACYEVCSREFPWLTVHDVNISRDPLGPINDPAMFYLCWCPLDPPPPLERKAHFALVYSEAMDADHNALLPEHRAHWNRTVGQISDGHWDGLFVHTPWMVATIDHFLRAQLDASRRVPVHLLPVGWEPLAMGMPRRLTVPPHALCYHGSLAGRRQLLVPFLRDQLGAQFYDATGAFGRGLLGALESSMASLYIAHSRVQSFSTWRLWQALAAGCPLLAEPGDSWPFVPGTDYLDIPQFTLDNVEVVAQQLIDLLSTSKLADTAPAALSRWGHMTTRAMIELMLVPTSLKMTRWPR